jgi:SOS regulatory protein LexA
MSMRVGKRSLIEVAHKVSSFYEHSGRMPSYAELGGEIGIRSKNAVRKWVGKLLEAGYLRADSRGRMAMGDKLLGLRFLGLVEAGFPTGAEEEFLDSLSLDSYLISNREATYVLSVKGDSMQEAGIREGDMVIVERGREAKFGDIVIAEVDGGFTMKYYKPKAGQPVLEPANKKYKPITPREDFKIAAVVTAVVRKYV